MINFIQFFADFCHHLTPLNIVIGLIVGVLLAQADKNGWNKKVFYFFCGIMFYLTIFMVGGHIAGLYVQYGLNIMVGLELVGFFIVLGILAFGLYKDHQTTKHVDELMAILKITNQSAASFCAAQAKIGATNIAKVTLDYYKLLCDYAFGINSTGLWTSFNKQSYDDFNQCLIQLVEFLNGHKRLKTKAKKFKADLLLIKRYADKRAKVRD